MRITVEELKEIYPQLAADAAKKPPKVTEEQIATYAFYLSDAFKLMRIDTVEAQAAYLAHGAVESDQFRRFTETQSWKQWYEDDPTSIRLDKRWLNEAAKNPRYKSYKMGGSINPNKDPSWQSSYIGRGPVQVTHRKNYAKTLQQMEQMAAEYEVAGQSDSASTLREAVTAIRADPRQAANPRFTFMFSAAYEKWSGGEKDVANVGEKATFSGGGAESRWVTGGAREKSWKARLKAGAWRRAREVLMRKAEPKPDTDPSSYTGPSYDPSSSRIPA
jgi:predicted chitinase